MLLNPKYKKSIVPLVTEKLFKGFDSKKHNEVLEKITLTISSRRNEHDAVGIKYKNKIHIAFQTNSKFKVHDVMPGDPSAAAIEEWLAAEQNYNIHTANFRNYLSTGMAMSHTIECICQIFPQVILNAFNEANVSFQVGGAPLPEYRELPTNNPKFCTFVEKNQIIVDRLKRQLVVDMLSPDNPHAKDTFWK